MLKMPLLLIFIVLNCSLAVFADETCDPIIPAGKISLICTEKPKTYFIAIQKYKSPKECIGNKFQTARSATVKIYITKHIETLEIDGKDFEYALLNEDRSYFKSPINGLNLIHCTSPGTGGISIGN